MEEALSVLENEAKMCRQNAAGAVASAIGWEGLAAEARERAARHMARGAACEAARLQLMADKDQKGVPGGYTRVSGIEPA